MSIVLYEVHQRIAYITLNRPEKRNALNDQMASALTEKFLQAEADNDVKVIVLKANGDVFCAGADLEYLQSLQNNSYDENLKDSKKLMNLFRTIYCLKKVVIAQVNGHAIAGGCGLVSVCDFAFSVDTANFGYSEVKIGFVPAIVMDFLVKKIGEARAKEMLITGTFIKAKEAMKWNLINESIEEGNLEEIVTQFAQKLCVNNSGNSMELIKKLFSESDGKTFEERLINAANVNALARSTEDCKKGISSFLNKQKLEW
ncbi:MAG: enoyl-CoA hydratase/isomerase family protein [Cytophagales bacterium]|nr:MAG: enoyl-CoA hydratase/isomerase family protein [Cytophagales bacterium]